MLCSVDPQGLRLTRHDDKIYDTFRKQFPDLKLDLLSEDELKSEDGKKVLICPSFIYHLFPVFCYELQIDVLC